MHWWQIAIRLILIANCFGNVRDAVKAVRDYYRERLHWLIPKAVAWGLLFFALLPTRYGGVGPQYWKLVIVSGFLLWIYAVIMEITDSSFPDVLVFSLEVPHIGRIDPILIPPLMVALPLAGLLSVAAGIVCRHHVTSNDEVFLFGFPLALLFGVRLLLRRYSLSKLSDLIKLAKLRLPPPQIPAQHDWIKPDTEETPS